MIHRWRASALSAVNRRHSAGSGARAWFRSVGAAEAFKSSGRLVCVAGVGVSDMVKAHQACLTMTNLEGFGAKEYRKVNKSLELGLDAA